MQGTLPKMRFSKEFLAAVVGFVSLAPSVVAISYFVELPIMNGLIGAVVGLLLVGSISNCRFQVNAPTSSLMLVSADCFHTHGLLGLGIAVMIAGFMQIALGTLRVGNWFRVIPLSALNGIMAGIGIVIFATQIPRVFGVSQALDLPQLSFNHLTMGIMTLLLIVFWKKISFVPLKVRKVLPSFGVGLAFAALCSLLMGINISREYTINFISPYENLGSLNLTGELLLFAISIAAIASIKALITSAQLESQYDIKLNLNRELIVQGIGNIFSGSLGSLPISAHLVRSVTIREMGARYRPSVLMQGVMVIASFSMLSSVLYYIPSEGVSAIIAVCGFKLINFKFFKTLRRYGQGEVILALSTMLSVMFLDISYGLLVGLSIAAARLLATFSADLNVKIQKFGQTDPEYAVNIVGALTFLHLPRLYEVRNSIPRNVKVTVKTDNIYYFDKACIAFFSEWQNTLKRNSGSLFIDYSKLLSKSKFPAAQREDILKELQSMDRRKVPRSSSVGRREIDKIIYADLLEENPEMHVGENSDKKSA